MEYGHCARCGGKKTKEIDLHHAVELGLRKHRIPRDLVKGVHAPVDHPHLRAESGENESTDIRSRVALIAR